MEHLRHSRFLNPQLRLIDFNPLQLPKNEEELLAINQANLCLARELARLGIPKHFSELMPDQVRVYDEVNYRKLGSTRSYGLNHIDILRQSGKVQTFRLILHENIHKCSSEKVKDGENVRHGYNHRYKNGATFHALDEAVVSKMTIELVERAKNDYYTKEELMGFDNTYHGRYAIYIQILNHIIANVADLRLKRSSLQKCSKGAVWDDFKRGLFTGDTQHLFSEISNVCGTDALYVLAFLDNKSRAVPGNVTLPWFQHRQLKLVLPQIIINPVEATRVALQYFQTDDPHERSKLAELIFSGAELGVIQWCLSKRDGEYV